MRTLTAYTPMQIRACGEMLEALKGKRSPEELIEFARTLRDPKMQRTISRYRLVLPRPESQPLSTNEFLLAIGWENVRAWRKLQREFLERNISDDEIKQFIRRERQSWLNEGSFGRRKP